MSQSKFTESNIKKLFHHMIKLLDERKLIDDDEIARFTFVNTITDVIMYLSHTNKDFDKEKFIEKTKKLFDCPLLSTFCKKHESLFGVYEQLYGDADIEFSIIIPTQYDYEAIHHLIEVFASQLVSWEAGVHYSFTKSKVDRDIYRFLISGTLLDCKDPAYLEDAITDAIAYRGK